MKKILILNQDQFGYHTDTYQYCRYLRRFYAITYLCWDYGSAKVEQEGITILYVSRSGNKLRRLSRYIQESMREIRKGKYDLVFVVHFPTSSLLPLLLGRRKMILDVRTGFVRNGPVFRIIYDMCLLFDSLAFSRVTIISESLRHQLHIPAARCHVLPLGAEEVSVGEKQFREIRLFYVGSLDFRNIDATVDGFDRFCTEMNGNVAASYDIVGFGMAEEERRLTGAIQRARNSRCITFHGRIPNKDLKPFLERNNVGIAFIPMKRHYQVQPATKVFEYLLAGMVVLATKTIENARVINSSNGVLVSDTAEGVYTGLMEIHRNLGTYDSSAIKSASRKYTLENIIFGNLKPLFDRQMADHHAPGRVHE